MYIILPITAYISLYEFNGTHSAELSIRKGEILRVYNGMEQLQLLLSILTTYMYHDCLIFQRQRVMTGCKLAEKMGGKDLCQQTTLEEQVYRVR